MTFGENFTNLKNRAIHSLGPLITGISSLLNSEPVSAFINTVGAGLDQLGVLFNGIVNGAIWFGQVIQANWPIIAGLLAATLVVLTGMGINFAIMAYQQIPALITKLWLMVTPILTQAAAWMVANMPLLIIAGVIGLLVMAMISFGISVEQVVGFVTGVFFALYAFVYNIVASLYNTFVSFAEFLVNLFIDPIYAVKKLIYDLAMTFGGYMYNMIRSAEDFAGGFMKIILSGINGVLKGFNWLVEKVNGIFGTDFKTAELFDENNIHAVSDSVKSMLDQIEKPVSNKDVVSFQHMEYKNIADSFTQGNELGIEGTQNAMDKVQNGLNSLMTAPDSTFNANPAPYNPDSNKSNVFDSSSSSPAIPSISNVGKVDKVGSVEDTVDISSEDLKMMRELAEMKSIQNFVTLTPTVQVTTGPVTNNADINTIVSQIERVLEEEISSSAAGVYA